MPARIARAWKAVEEAERILGEKEGFAPYFAERPGLEAELGKLSSALDRAMDFRELSTRCRSTAS